MHAVDYTKIHPFTCTMLSPSFKLNVPPIVFVVDRHQNNDKRNGKTDREKEMVKQTVGKMPTPQQFANFQQLPKKRKQFLGATAEFSNE